MTQKQMRIGLYFCLSTILNNNPHRVKFHQYFCWIITKLLFIETFPNAFRLDTFLSHNYNLLHPKTILYYHSKGFMSRFNVNFDQEQIGQPHNFPLHLLYKIPLIYGEGIFILLRIIETSSI